MPLRPLEPPEAVRRAAARHVYQLATPHRIFPALRDVVREDLELVAPHRVYILELDSIAAHALERAKSAGWRFLVASGDRIVASAEIADDSGSHSALNSGPFVASTTAAIDEVERLPEVVHGDFELRILKVPGLYVVAAWLSGEHDIVVPLAPAPSFLEAGRVYSEDEFLRALDEPARRILAMASDTSGG